ncbi:MAG: hypothetical protein K9G57_01830 [Ignavibacteriales bacterium]|nr:hypothetical protein [Ignavibacteriales bacterium]
MKRTENFNLFFPVSGILLIFTALFLPIANLGDYPISILPFFTQMTDQQNIWNWVDISAFSISLCIVVILGFFFILKKNTFALRLIGAISAVCSLIILLALWMTDIESANQHGPELEFSFGLLFLMVGNILVYINKKKSE